MVNTANDARTAPFGAPPRPLNEDVLQSAEEAVLTNPDAVQTLQEGDLSPPSGLPAGTQGWSHERLARMVAERPLLYALGALAAGGLVAALVRRALSRPED
jgi:hypothetical protein